MWELAKETEVAREAVGVLLWKSNGETVRGNEADSRRGNPVGQEEYEEMYVYGCQAHSKLTPYNTGDWQEREFHVGQRFGDRHSAESIHCAVISESGE